MPNEYLHRRMVAMDQQPYMTRGYCFGREEVMEVTPDYDVGEEETEPWLMVRATNHRYNVPMPKTHRLYGEAKLELMRRNMAKVQLLEAVLDIPLLTNPDRASNQIVWNRQVGQQLVHLLIDPDTLETRWAREDLRPTRTRMGSTPITTVSSPALGFLDWGVSTAYVTQSMPVATTWRSIVDSASRAGQ